MTIKEQIKAELDKAQAIAAAADAAKRDLNPDEIQRVEGHLRTVKVLQGQLAESESPNARALADFLAGGRPPANEGSASKSPVGSKAAMAAAWAKDAAEAVQKAMGRGADGSKALVSGTVDVPSIVGHVAEIVGRPVSVLDLIKKPSSPARGDGNAFSYLRQTARTNNATAVPDGGAKPTSVYSFTDVESKFSVYAALSESLPLRYLSDFNGLVDILKSQLAAGVLEAIEADILAGPGTGDRFTGVLNTSGIQTQAAVTGDILTTLSNARYKALTAFQTPTAWVLNPADAQKLELLRESGTTGAFMFRNGLADAEKFLGDYPIVQTVLMPAGTALLGDWDQVELLVREGNHIDVDTAGTLFTTNSFVARAEGRFGLKVGRPLAFVRVTLPA
ncbi:phage major capsid protein [Microbacterium invictum]|uniref:Phage major capsid protein n=1 Tax=Microbacterium invictum TaxID=515415 RepID=A0ABZ0V608_9MICO|nr:phage major capsid protein [Microbacterium invictum]WQB69027.1 phage major capsid protein [Microbacterium invictum]